MKNTVYSIVKLPADIQITLFLIREELKSRKFFRKIQEAGLSDCYYQPHLDLLILRSFNLDEDSDKIFETYNKIIEHRSKKIDADIDSIMKQALKVYMELKQLKKKLKGKEEE